MMVVIGIIAILGAVVVPGFKKAYSDFKTRQAYDLINTMLSAMRSHYLIYNEGAYGYYHYCCSGRLLPFLSGSKWVEGLTFKETRENGEKVYQINLRDSYLNSICGQTHTNFVINGKVSNYFTLGVKKRPYFWDDLLRVFSKKGYRVKEHVYTETLADIIFRFPEDHSYGYFR